MNAAFAGSVGVPIVLASGDSAFTTQFAALLPTRTVSTKTAVTPAAARLPHPSVVHERLAAATSEAMNALSSAVPWSVGTPVRVRLRLADVTTPQILQAIPGVRQVDGYTVAFTADTLDEAYRLIRLMYRFISL